LTTSFTVPSPPAAITTRSPATVASSVAWSGRSVFHTSTSPRPPERSISA
jgi:hypothetical protein